MSKWINIKDRDPKIWRTCIFACEKPDIDYRWVCSGYKNFDGYHIHGEHNSKGIKITHWMPLPDVPEDDNE